MTEVQADQSKQDSELLDELEREYGDIRAGAKTWAELKAELSRLSRVEQALRTALTAYDEIYKRSRDAAEAANAGALLAGAVDAALSASPSSEHFRLPSPTLPPERAALVERLAQAIEVWRTDDRPIGHTMTALLREAAAALRGETGAR